MPFISKTNFNNFNLYLWKIEESEVTLENGIAISSALRERLKSARSEEHRKGILSVHQLMKVADVLESDLYYDSDGCPNLKFNKYISISHSKYFSAIVLSEFQIGVDIEFCREKIIRIAPRFLHNKEHFALGKIEELTYVWTAKEAIYKAFRTSGINFSKQIYIDKPFDEGKVREGKVVYNDQHKLFELSSIKFDSHFVTIAYEKN
ncbi:MAG: 4'-phosphopantetheinyl transferase superfamily protein [Flavobacteriaceae bacterium]|nr:4'-phosphopantetheinyl transferase superfamily protein [Flavobacteriaceae bacterium]